MKHVFRFGSLSGALLMPVLALAQFSGGGGEISNFFQAVTNFIQGSLIPILIALAFVVFVWGAIKYFLFTEAERDEGKQLMFWGIIAFVVIVSIWGIVALIANGLGFGGETTLDVLPDPPGQR